MDKDEMIKKFEAEDAEELPKENDLYVAATRNALKRFDKGDTVEDITEDYLGASLNKRVMSDEAEMGDLAKKRAEQFRAKEERKRQEEEAKRLKAEADAKAAEAEKQRKERERLEAEGQTDVQKQTNMFQKYEWCLRKVGIRGNAPTYLCILGLIAFTFLAAVYWLSIGPVVGIVMIAMEQLGEFTRTLGKFAEDSAKGLKGFTKFIIIFGACIIALGLVAGIVLAALSLKQKYLPTI